MHFFQISTGLGAGNLGDEMMARAFWRALPPGWHGEVEVFPMAEHYRGGYPQQHEYVPVDSSAYRAAALSGVPGLLACGTPVHEVEGLHFPMRFIAERLDAFHGAGTPVHAVGVGVDRLYTRRGRALFERSFLPIATWTVRNEQCRQALLQMGVPAERVAVGADWAWLYEAAAEKQDWAAAHLRQLGVDPNRPILAVDVVNLVWRNRRDIKRAVAEALDWAAGKLGLQIVFLCNECRQGGTYDEAAAREVASMMRTHAAHVEPLYFSIDEMIGFLAHARVSLAMRYHFAIMSCLAGAAPVALARSQKIAGLCDDLQIEPIRLRDCTAERLFLAIESACKIRPQTVGSLRERAEGNLNWLLSPAVVGETARPTGR